MNKNYLKNILKTGSCLLFCLFIGACKKEKKNAQAATRPAIPVETITVQEEKISFWLPLTGSVYASNAVTVSATIEGPIAFCPWREGDQVKAAEELLVIDRPIYQREVEAAKAAVAVAEARLADLKAGARSEEIAQAAEMVTQLEENTRFTENDLKRIEQMVQSGSLPGEEREKARVAFVKSQTELAAARERLQMLKSGPTETALAVQAALLDEAIARLKKAEAVAVECQIYAPFAGTISKVYVRRGDLATVRAPLLDLFEPESCVVRFSIPERFALQIKKGTALKMNFDAAPEKTYNSEISLIYPELESKSRTILAEAKIPEGLLAKPGMFVRLQVAGRELPAALTVPDSAILSMPDNSLSIFVVENEKAKRRRVTVELESGSKIALASGVSAGEQVIIRGHELLKDDSSVRILKKASATEATVKKGE